VCKVFPNDKDARKKFEECEKIVKRIAFEEAINSDSPKVITSETIDVNNFTVESSYDGPRIPEDGQITLEFVQGPRIFHHRPFFLFFFFFFLHCFPSRLGLLERFKNQKTVHKKYVFMVSC
jgi:serine/threonine-protein phosphatase 5